jgi:riboflavin synthase
MLRVHRKALCLLGSPVFTGIIDRTGTIESLALRGDSGRLRIRLAKPLRRPALSVGASIAVNGCCLTVVEFSARHFAADLSGETLRRTSFGRRKAGDMVNLERPLAAGSELGGHFVQGHVDAVGKVLRLAREGANWWLAVRVPSSISRYVAEKGSMAVDGISLTVARWRGAVAEFAVIPHTHSATNVRTLGPGDPVNLEADVLAKYVERLLDARAPAASRFSIGDLVEQGF